MQGTDEISLQEAGCRACGDGSAAGAAGCAVGEEVIVIERKAVAPRGLCFFLYVDIVGIGYAEEVV
jgi:hypothetical protein